MAFHVGVLNATGMLQPALHYKLFTACPDEYAKLVQLVALARHISAGGGAGVAAMRRVKLNGDAVRDLRWVVNPTPVLSNTVRNFPTHGQLSAAQGSPTTVSA